MSIRFRVCPTILVVLLATAVGASAQQDVMCICLDPMTPDSCGGNAVIPAGEPTMIYLCLVDPSGTPVLAWLARVTDSRQDGDIIGEWVMNGLDVDMDPDNYMVAPEPAPAYPNAANVVVLGSMWLRVLDDTAPIEFFVGPIPGDVVFPEGTPGYTHTLGINTPATVCSGDYDAPVFSINGVVAMDGITWGAIKGAYMSSPVGGR
ncbi:MAG: hypothetical protein Q7W29_08145 [bacterium]|nr:hypothetical protein [bacterium]